MNENQILIYESLWTAYRINKHDVRFHSHSIARTIKDIYDDFSPCMWRLADEDFMLAIEAFLREVEA